MHVDYVMLHAVAVRANAPVGCRRGLHVSTASFVAYNSLSSVAGNIP